ncbi:MAG: DUF2058 domain-containing protein [Cocleimonas sp.]
MAGSLQDQFLAAGLVKKQKAKNIQTAKKKAQKQSRVNNTALVDEAGDLAKQAQDEQRQKSQALNKQNKVEAEQKEVLAQIRQIITLNSIKKAPKEMTEDKLSTYNFTHNNKIKTLYISPQNHDLVSRGVIAIASLEEGGTETYHLIPAEAANKINERNSEAVVLLNAFLSKDKSVTTESELEKEEDPYAGFEVPDDLMW